MQVDLFNGLNNDILAREGLVALDMKHSVSPGPVSVTPVGTPGPITHIKQDMMYPSSMSSPAPPNSRQVRLGAERAREERAREDRRHILIVCIISGTKRPV